MNLRAVAKQALLTGVAAITRRHPVLLPSAAADDTSLLDVSAVYRVESEDLDLCIHHEDAGVLTVALLLPDGPNRSRLHWQSEPAPYCGPSNLRFNLRTGSVHLGDRMLGHVAVPLPNRRFCWSMAWQDAEGTTSRSRLTGHYVPGTGLVGDAYYAGDTYVDYEAESRSTRAAIVDLARRYPFTGPAFEVGCATGALLEDLQRAGFDVVGVDYSAWAVDRARERVGADRVWQVDIARNLNDPAVMSRAPFGALIMLSVLEHFAEPFDIFERLSALVRPGGRLFLTTTNAGGLGRSLFQQDWEGYFDWTHLGVDQVSARSLREHLERIGWRVELLETGVIWDGNADPTHATLREWWASDARFRRLLVERELGDLITCVATRR